MLTYRELYSESDKRIIDNNLQYNTHPKHHNAFFNTIYFQNVGIHLNQRLPLIFMARLEISFKFVSVVAFF